jgi:hypothetical protein
MSRLVLPLILALGLAQPVLPETNGQQTRSLSAGLTPFLNAISGSVPRFQLSGKIQIAIDDKPQSIEICITRFDTCGLRRRNPSPRLFDGHDFAPAPNCICR